MKLLKATIIGISLIVNAPPVRAETAMERYEYVRKDWFQQVVSDYTDREGLVCDNTTRATEILMGQMALLLAIDDGLKTALEVEPASKLRSWVETILQVMIDLGDIECHG